MQTVLSVIVAACLVQLVGQGTASAGYQLEPISRVFAPAGSEATQSFELVNHGTERVALTVSFVTLERDDAYAETNHDADDDFLAYPPQLVLAAGARQTVRVTWLGNPRPALELAYRIVVTQVPINTLDHTAAPEVQPVGKVRVFLNYRGTVFIRPANAVASVSPAASAVAAGNVLALTLVNSGRATGRITSCAMHVAPAAGGPDIVLPAASLAPLHNTRVLAGGKRRYLIAWPPHLTAGLMKVSGRCSVEP